MIYKLVKDVDTGTINIVNKIMEGRVLSIPFDEANTDYQEYLEWLSEGNEPEEAD